MKILIFLIILHMQFTGVAQCQNKEIKGKIINDKFTIIYGAKILINDSVQIGTSDSLGLFHIVIPDSIKNIKFWSAGRELTTIESNKFCCFYEIIMLSMPNYDVSILIFNRYRKRAFDKIKHLHKIAYKKGVFQQKQTCYKQLFTLI